MGTARSEVTRISTLPGDESAATGVGTLAAAAAGEEAGRSLRRNSSSSSRVNFPSLFASASGNRWRTFCKGSSAGWPAERAIVAIQNAETAPSSKKVIRRHRMGQTFGKNRLSAEELDLH